MSEFNQANVSSLLMLVLAPVIGFFGMDAYTGNLLVGALAGLIVLSLQIWNETHNSGYFSKDEDMSPCEDK